MFYTVHEVFHSLLFLQRYLPACGGVAPHQVLIEEKEEQQMKWSIYIHKRMDFLVQWLYLNYITNEYEAVFKIILSRSHLFDMC